MARTSDNGWPVDPAARTRLHIGADTDGAEVRAGDVAKAFTWFMHKFHASVEPIKVANGYRTSAYNDSLSGSIRNSNHISGTAVDLNGASHPNEFAHAQAHTGKPYVSGFSAGQTARIRELLKYAGVFEWGMDFPVNARDAMHFAIKKGTTAAQVAAFIAKITPKQEDDPMPDLAGPKTTSVAQKLTAKKWHTLVLVDAKKSSTKKNEVSILARDVALRVDADLDLTITGLPVGQVVQVRAFRCDAAGKRTYSYGMREIKGTDGTVFDSKSWKPDIPANQRLRFEVMAPSASQTKVVITAVEARAHFWEK